MDRVRTLITEYWPIVLAGFALAVVLWLLLGKAPRRRRAYRRGQRRLQRLQWREALGQADKIRALGSLSAAWQGKVDRLAGEAHRQGSGQYLTEQKYEESLDHLVQASRLLGLDEGNARDHVAAAMLAEIRRLFATTQTRQAQALIDRVLRLQADCGEARFWEALCWLREGHPDQARASLLAIQENGVIDPPFYLGLLDLRAGQPGDALRRFSTALRLDPTNPFINWQLGQAMTAAGSDPAMAARALQRAAGPAGLPRWESRPDRVWVDGLPGPEKSYLRRLTEQHAFACPLLGGDPKAMLRQARLALAQAQYRLGQYGEAAELGRLLLGETAPTLPVLRTLGLALARLEQFDEAFKHLRAAYDLEEPKQAATAGYLALCGALGKPIHTEDKISNIVWAIGLLRQFTIAGDHDWATIHARIFQESRSVGLLPAVEDVRHAAEALTSVAASDPLAAGVYDDLAELNAATPAQAWLYGRAVQLHDVRGKHDLTLLGMALRQPDDARAYYQSRDWDFDDLQCHYLIRWSEARPATFPPELGDDAPSQARRLLLRRAERLEAAGQLAEAMTTAAALARLLPGDAAALDRLACLHYRQGAADQAVQVLADWQARHPADPRPVLRRAILEQERGNRLARNLALKQALDLAKGKQRADVAWLAARLTLNDADGQQALPYLLECLRDEPTHPEALAFLAALRWQAGDRDGLANQAVAMRAADGDAAFHYLAAVCHLEARDYGAALTAAQQAASDVALIQEARCLMARAQLGLNGGGAAVPHLKMVATDAACLSVDSARALFGRVRFEAGDFDDAALWWQQIPAPRRAGWQLGSALPASVYLAGLTAYQEGRYEESSQRFRDAGRLGCRDRRLGLLLQLALFKAGQRLLDPAIVNHDADHLPEKAAALLEKCIQVGCKDPHAALLLAVARERQGRLDDARAALAKIAAPDAATWLRRGVLAMKERQLATAEEEFAQACALDPGNLLARHNLLLTRLSLGHLPAAREVLSSLLDQAPDDPIGQMLAALLALDNFSLLGHPTLATLDAEAEDRLLAFIRQLGHLETARHLLEALQQARPESAAVRDAQFEVALLAGRQQLLRCETDDVETLLTPWSRQRQVVRAPLLLMHNLLGCANFLDQNFASAVQHFNAAIRLADVEPRLHQNRALALELGGDLHLAEGAWQRFIDACAASEANRHLAVDALVRLATRASDRLNYAEAMPALERAHRLAPHNIGVLDRLFQLYRQLDRSDLARRTLLRLNELLPGDPNLDLYDLELAPLRRGDDLKPWIDNLERIVQQHPRERRVQDRAAVLLGTYLGMIQELTRQSTDQLSRAVRQVRSLRQDEINWRAVHKVMRDLRHEFTLLRHGAERALAIDTHPEHLRQLHEAVSGLDRKIEETRRWQG